MNVAVIRRHVEHAEHLALGAGLQGASAVGCATEGELDLVSVLLVASEVREADGGGITAGDSIDTLVVRICPGTSRGTLRTCCDLGHHRIAGVSEGGCDRRLGMHP